MIRQVIKAGWYIFRWGVCQLLLGATVFLMPKCNEGNRFAQHLYPYMAKKADFSDILPFPADHGQ